MSSVHDSLSSVRDSLSSCRDSLSSCRNFRSCVLGWGWSNRHREVSNGRFMIGNRALDNAGGHFDDSDRHLVTTIRSLRSVVRSSLAAAVDLVRRDLENVSRDHNLEPVCRPLESPEPIKLRQAIDSRSAKLDPLSRSIESMSPRPALQSTTRHPLPANRSFQSTNPIPSFIPLLR